MLLRRIAAAFGYEPRPGPEPEGVRLIRRLAEQLNEHASKFQRTAGQIVMLEQRIELLEGDSVAWERRAKSSAVARDLDIARDVARICGRIEGKLQAARAELRELTGEERHLRELLTRGRRDFVRLLEDAQAIGHDVSRCVLNIDLTRPEMPVDASLCDDEEADFMARVVDAHGVH